MRAFIKHKEDAPCASCSVQGQRVSASTALLFLNLPELRLEANEVNV